MSEIWKDIKGYEGLYQISDKGRVYSCSRKKVKNLFKDKLGYYTTILCKNNKVKHFRVNRLVAEAFIPNPNNLPQVNHKDENPGNNSVDNLEWCSVKYNADYGTANSRRRVACSKKGRKHRISIEVYDTNNQLVGTFKDMISASIALNCYRSGIYNALKKGHLCKGYVIKSPDFSF